MGSSLISYCWKTNNTAWEPHEAQKKKLGSNNTLQNINWKREGQRVHRRSIPKLKKIHDKKKIHIQVILSNKTTKALHLLIMLHMDYKKGLDWKLGFVPFKLAFWS